MTDNSDPWNDFNAPMSGDFPDAFKFDTVGVSIAGTITNVRKAEFDGKGVPELWIQTDNGERSVLCGQANLMTQLLEHRPLVGDRIAIVYTGQRKAKLGMAKLFDVVVKRYVEGEAVLDDVPAPSAPKTAADLL